MEGKLDKGKTVVGVKRRPTEDMLGSAMKWPCIDSRPLDLEVVDCLVNLVNSTWDRVVKAREAVSAVEERL